MVAPRRFGPLVVLLAIGFAVLVARSFQIQVLEHEIWAQQAASLVRSAKVLPSHRGKFLDRNGRVLVRDEDVYGVEFRYRDFRRKHPLGSTAHARSALELRAVPLDEAEAHLEAWIAGLVSLSPHALSDFARGAGGVFGGVPVQPCADPAFEQRSRRANDARFYLATLLGLDDVEQRRMRKLPEGPERERSWLELVASWRGLTPDRLLARIQASARDACAELESVAPLLDSDSAATSRAPDATTPRERVVLFLERVRGELEDAAADEVFRIATGFGPGFVSTESLRSTFDLGFLAHDLRWDAARLESWIASRRALRERTLVSNVLPRILAQVRLESGDAARAGRLLDELAALYARDRTRADDGAPLPWTDLDDLAVVAEIETLFAGVRPRASNARARGLPFQDAELREISADLEHPWRIVGLLSDLAGANDGGADQPLRQDASTAFWSEISRRGADFESARALQELTRIVRALERRHASISDQMFAAARVARGASDADVGPLALSEERLDRAAQQEKYVQIDKSSRPLRLPAEPDYDVVERIARSPEFLAGFEVRETTRRVQVVRDRDGVPCASTLIGDVRKPSLREILAQSTDERRLQSLTYKLLRSAADEREIKALASRVQRADEWTGDHGLEDYFDAELRGRPGWFETEGLEDRARGDKPVLVEAAVDGRDVVLTLDAELVIAAQETLAHLEVPGDEDHTDVLWFQHPVGAIVLLALDGDVLAVASVPAVPGEKGIPGRDREREIVRERTLQRPTFNPPGSVIKPFVAVYALDRLGLDPNATFACVDVGKGRGGFETMHCLGLHAHSNLHRALAVSCNSFFAQLGLLYSPQQFLEMAHAFGFGEPTGIRVFGGRGRSGLREDPSLSSKSETLLAADLSNRQARLQVANGLGHVEATPMQVARATAALATGRLPNVRIARSIGSEAVIGGGRELGIGAASLDHVSAAMRACVESDEGSAHGKGLDAHTLGFTLACKTGSADYDVFREVPGAPSEDLNDKRAGKVRKHTWVAGWFPAEAPKAVIVVYLHDVSETASRTAVHVAAQFLRTDAVRRFVAGQDGPR